MYGYWGMKPAPSLERESAFSQVKLLASERQKSNSHLKRAIQITEKSGVALPTPQQTNILCFDYAASF
jgi:hypothetical protein